MPLTVDRLRTLVVPLATKVSAPRTVEQSMPVATVEGAGGGGGGEGGHAPSRTAVQDT